MIVCRIENSDSYRGLSKTLDTTFDWIKKGGWENLPVGRHPIAGDKAFALVQEYETKALEDCLYEAHRKYIDIQMLVSGKEFIWVRGVAGLQVRTPYTPDIEFLDAADAIETHVPEGIICDIHRIALVPGVVAVFFPEDAHKPCARVAESSERVHKVVVKVAI